MYSRYVRSYQVNVKYISYVKSSIASLHHFEKKIPFIKKYIVCVQIAKKGEFFICLLIIFIYDIFSMYISHISKRLFV